MRPGLLAVCSVLISVTAWAGGPSKEFRAAFGKAVQPPKRAQPRTYGVVVGEGLLSTSEIGRHPIAGRVNTYAVQLRDGEILDTVERADADARKLASPLAPGEFVAVKEVVYKDREVRIVLQPAKHRVVTRPDQAIGETFLAEVRITVPDDASGVDAATALEQLSRYVKFSAPDDDAAFGDFLRQRSEASRRK